MVPKEKNIMLGPEPLLNYASKYNSIGEFILEHLNQFKDRGDCLIHGITKDRITYNELLENSVKLAEGLKMLGMKKGDVIAISSENHIKYFYSVIAALYLGITVTPMNNNYTQDEYVHCLNISKPKIIFCSSIVFDKMSQLIKKLPFVQRIITLDKNINSSQEVSTLDDILALASSVRTYDYNSYETICIDSHHVAFILYSSGTTGRPKGVMLSHHNLLIAWSVMDDARFTTPESTVLGVLPFFHIFGLMTILGSMCRAKKVIVLDKFDFEIFLKSIQEYKISNLVMVPPIMVMLAKHPLVAKYDLSSVNKIFCGAAPLSKGIAEAVKKRLNINDIGQGYGLSEIASCVFLTPPNAARVGSVGVLLPYLECKVLDLTSGISLGALERGELCYKGPSIMKGYCGDIKASEEIIDKEGWFHSGDVGYYDEEGYFYVVDRIKELIKYKGFQVAPAELEYVLLSHPYVKDAAVIGIPDEEAGELPMAFVVKESGKKVSGEEIQQFVEKQVSPQKRLRAGVAFINEIPKNPSGKILRRNLRDLGMIYHTFISRTLRKSKL